MKEKTRYFIVTPNSLYGGFSTKEELIKSDKFSRSSIPIKLTVNWRISWKIPFITINASVELELVDWLNETQLILKEKI
jgi:hypothetical protein